MTPGKILYRFYHRPLRILQNTFRVGLRRTAQINSGKKAMIGASAFLRELIYEGQETFHVYFLTGKRYWFQTAFCLYSLQKAAEVNIHAFIIDDGSFDEELVSLVANQFPNTTTIIRSNEINKLLDSKLPVEHFPVLRKRRLEYPHIRKLTDVHILKSNGPKLVLDSDMLFFHKPDELLNWLKGSTSMLFMKDITESYGYSKKLMQQLADTDKIPERLNVGVAGMSSEQISWELLESWTDELLKKEGSSYLQEQALTAMLAANVKYQILDEKRYKVLPCIEGKIISEVLHHYVAEAKYDYFVKGWRLLK